MNDQATCKDGPYRLFAWQGFSFKTPADWNLAEYRETGGVSRVRLHDDFGLRLEFEWLYTRHIPDTSAVRRRYDRLADSMSADGAIAENTGAMPENWSACLYSMPDGKRLMTAYRLAPDRKYFCLLKIHFESASKREAERLVRLIASSFQLHSKGLVPWAVYDVYFKLHDDFRLTATSFQAGAQMFVFEWRARRLYLWFFTPADMLIKSRSKENWCADYLNAFRDISGVRFEPGFPGNLQADHQWRRFWGNVEPILRGCLRYRAWCRLTHEKNQMFLGVFNYRGKSDLLFLDSAIEPPFAPENT